MSDFYDLVPHFLTDLRSGTRILGHFLGGGWTSLAVNTEFSLYLASPHSGIGFWRVRIPLAISGCGDPPLVEARFCLGPV